MKKTKLSFLVFVLLFSSQLLAQNLNQPESRTEAAPVKNNKAHLLTVGEYVIFLNAVAQKSDLHQLYNASLMENVILRSDSGDGYNYASMSEKEKNPMRSLSKFDAMRYCNWMENGSLVEAEIGDQAITSTETGTYLLNNDEVIFINPEANYHLAEKGASEGVFYITQFYITQKTIASKTSPLMMFAAEEGTGSVKAGEQNNLTDRTGISRSDDQQGRISTSSPAIIQRRDFSTGIAESSSSDLTTVNSVNANGANVNGINTSIIAALAKKNSGIIFNGASARTFLAKALAVTTGIIGQKFFSITSQSKVQASEKLINKPYSNIANIANREVSQQSLVTRTLFPSFSIKTKPATQSPSIRLLVKNAFLTKTAEVRNAFSQLGGRGVLGMNRLVVYCDTDSWDEATKRTAAAYSSRDKAQASLGIGALSLWDKAIGDATATKEAWSKVVEDKTKVVEDKTKDYDKAWWIYKGIEKRNLETVRGNLETAKNEEATWNAHLTWWNAHKASYLADNAKDNSLDSSHNEAEGRWKTAIQESEKAQAAWLNVAKRYEVEYIKALEQFKKGWKENFERAKNNNIKRIAVTTRWKVCLEAVKLEAIANNAIEKSNTVSMGAEADLSNALQKVQEVKRAWIRSEETSKNFDSKIAATSKTRENFWANKEAEIDKLLITKREENRKLAFQSNYVTAKNYCDNMLGEAEKARSAAYDLQSKHIDFSELVEQWKKAFQAAEELAKQYVIFKETIEQNKANLPNWSDDYKLAEKEQKKWQAKASFYKEMQSINDSLFSLKQNEDKINDDIQTFNGRSSSLAAEKYAKMSHDITVQVDTVKNNYDALFNKIRDYYSSQEKDRHFSEDAKRFLKSCKDQANNRGTYWFNYKTPLKENKADWEDAQAKLNEAKKRKTSFETNDKKSLEPVANWFISSSVSILSTIQAMRFFAPPTTITEIETTKTSLPSNEPKFLRTAFSAAFKNSVKKMGSALIPTTIGLAIGAVGGLGKGYLLLKEMSLNDDITEASNDCLTLQETIKIKSLAAQKKANSTFTSEQLPNDQIVTNDSSLTSKTSESTNKN